MMVIPTHTDAYSGYNGLSWVKRCPCYTHLHRAFVDVLPSDVHTPEESKPAEAILQLNKLFDIEAELENLSPDQKKKERLVLKKPLLEVFGSWTEKNAITSRISGWLPPMEFNSERALPIAVDLSV